MTQREGAIFNHQEQATPTEDTGRGGGKFRNILNFKEKDGGVFFGGRKSPI